MKLIIERDIVSETWIAYIEGRTEIIAEGKTIEEAIQNLQKDLELVSKSLSE